MAIGFNTLEDDVPVNEACPCLHTTPCDERCTCVNGFSSTGCHRCCSYGSKEQRKAMAEHLVELQDLVYCSNQDCFFNSVIASIPCVFCRNKALKSKIEELEASLAYEKKIPDNAYLKEVCELPDEWSFCERSFAKELLKARGQNVELVALLQEGLDYANEGKFDGNGGEVWKDKAMKMLGIT